jgi:hypothetical protein
MAKEKKLSNRAEKILNEIQRKDMVPDSNDNASSSYESLKPSKLKKFSSVKYRQFYKKNQMISWTAYFLILIAIILFILSLGIGYYTQYDNYRDISRSKLPKYSADILATQKKIKALQEEVLAIDTSIEFELSQIPTFENTDKLLNVMSKLFEDARLKIIKQDISINKTPVSVTFQLPPVKKPIGASIIFSPIDLNSPSKTIQTKAKADERNLAEKISGKKLNKRVKAKAKKGLKNKGLKNESATALVKDNFESLLGNIRSMEIAKNNSLIKNLPKNISFVSYHFQLKGQYLDYFKVRSRLNRIYPYLRIPVEEIVAQENTSELHIRAIYDIPIQSTK